MSNVCQFVSECINESIVFLGVDDLIRQILVSFCLDPSLNSVWICDMYSIFTGLQKYIMMSFSNACWRASQKWKTKACWSYWHKYLMWDVINLSSFVTDCLFMPLFYKNDNLGQWISKMPRHSHSNMCLNSKIAIKLLQLCWHIAKFKHDDNIDRYILDK